MKIFVEHASRCHAVRIDIAFTFVAFVLLRQHDGIDQVVGRGTLFRPHQELAALEVDLGILVATHHPTYWPHSFHGC